MVPWKRIASHVSVFAGLYCLICGLMWFFQTSFIYQPTIGAPTPSNAGLKDTKAVALTTADGVEIEGWVSSAAPTKPTIVLFHGNAGNLRHRVGLLKTLQSQGFGFVAIDYRGYGNSSGDPSEQGLYADARATLEYAQRDLRLAPKSIVLFGESVGTGVATQMATEGEFAALVLQSPYTSILDKVGERFPWLPASLLLTERFNNIDKIKGVDEPLLVFHGQQDNLFPLSMGEAVFAAARSKKDMVVFEGSGHNDHPVGRIVSEMTDFLDR